MVVHDGSVVANGVTEKEMREMEMMKMNLTHASVKNFRKVKRSHQFTPCTQWIANWKKH